MMRATWIVLGCLITTNAAAAQPAAPANPFEGASFYVGPEWRAEVESAAVAAPAKAAQIRSLANQPVALWVNSIDAAKNKVPRWLDEARGKLAVLVLYDLPNRDCSAAASAGELGAGDAARYRSEVVDPLAAQLRAHPDQRVAVIVEPDSLANLVTNAKVEKCAKSDALYRESIAYAVSTLAMPNVALYLDAGHSGGSAGTRTARRSPRSSRTCSIAPAARRRSAASRPTCRATAWCAATTAAARAEQPLPRRAHLRREALGRSREGRHHGQGIRDRHEPQRPPGARAKSANWCNVTNAGSASGRARRRRRRWTPTSGSRCRANRTGPPIAKAPGFDATCASEDAMRDAPAAGTFFPAYFLKLVEHANPPVQ
jgi:cellulose 1,4-beta-cellobiosidase